MAVSAACCAPVPRRPQAEILKMDQLQNAFYRLVFRCRVARRYRPAMAS